MKSLLLSLSFLIGMHVAFAQVGTINGMLISTNAPLANINIKLAGSSRTIKSNSEGSFQLSGLSYGSYVLSFSGIGYETKTLKVSLNSPVINVTAEMAPANANLSEVVVTGVNRATELRKSPIPIAVLSKKAMEQNGGTNLIESIVKGVAGVTAVTTGPNVSKPFIRGLGYNRVLTLYDGLRQEGQQWGDEHGIEVDEYGISRVEVVKGPASLSYGSDAVAGVINMIPAKPNFLDRQLNGDFSTNYQSNNGLFGASLGLGYAINNWKFTLRATTKAAHNYENKIDGLVFGTAFKEYNLSASARLDGNWGFTKTAVTYYDNKMEIPDGSRDSLSRRFTRQVLDTGDDIKNRPVVDEADLDRYVINPLHQRIQHFRFYNNSQFKFKSSDLNLLIGAQQSVRREYNHPTAPGQAGLYVVLNTLNYDLKYNLPEFAGIESTAGINGMYQTNRSREATDFPIPDYNLFDVGGFYFAKRTLGKVAVSGGLRIDRRTINWPDFYVGTDPLTGFGKQSTVNDAAADLQFPAFKKAYYGVSGSVGLTYNVSEKVLLKANLARGYRAPNITEIGSNGLDPGAHIVYLGNRTFKPEFNLQEDIGVMVNLHDADFSLEVFNNDIQNYIFQSRLTDVNGNPVVIVPGNLTYQYQQAKARLYGVEVAANLHPSNIKWLSFNHSFAYVVGLNKSEELLRAHGKQAKYLPFIPPLQIRSEVKVTAQQPIGFLASPYFKADVAIFADQNKFYALDNTETFTKGYTLFNAGMGASFRARSGKVVADLFVQVDNIFNIAYQSNLNRLKYFEYYQSSPNGKSGIYNMGRNFSFKLIIPF
ncbi:TonB-dependent receptor [Pedobacter endophyticus]|uniref:TonB-dependent receptor n=1 Tax=Pedobacter endophyticus TaxID=2789740 RepID=A0A7S9PZH5_9SPHI|nr:TonB-dependent receptor [Pedobacter endophyticus]QPH39950.1 TonB-dependent receptor [Pedobacter endophyticus]